MYKILRTDIKSFIPRDSELELIRENTVLHSYSHTGDNSLGEVFEVWVYNWLLCWAQHNSCVSLFTLKDSLYSGRRIQGLGYDNQGQIIISKEGRKLAEYDGLFVYKGCVIFVETSVSENRKYFRSLEQKLEKKRNLLKEVFKTEEIYCLMVTRPGKKSIKYRLLPFLVNLTLSLPRDITPGESTENRVDNLLVPPGDKRFTDIQTLVNEFLKGIR